MIRSFIINKYLAREFCKVVMNMSLTFFCLGFIVNLFEEINFFKDFQVGFDIPLKLSALFVPGMIYNMFPFVILLSGIWFFLKIKRTDEIVAMKVSGMSNFSIIIIPSVVAIILGIFFITSINPITSLLVKKYESIKGAYEKEQDYLAAITINGIWIKEKKFQKNYIIRASNLDNENIMNLTIYEFDRKNNFIRRIEAESANISSVRWSLKNVKIINADGMNISKSMEKFSYISMYDIKKIKSLYSNPDTISFWNIENEIKLLEERGYSTKEMESKLHRSLAYPFFLLSMILLSGVFTLGTNAKENNLNYIFIAIISSVVIYFFNDLSLVLGKTEKLPVEVSAWMPIVIIFIFSAAGVIHANQK